MNIAYNYVIVSVFIMHYDIYVQDNIHYSFRRLFMKKFRAMVGIILSFVLSFSISIPSFAANSPVAPNDRIIIYDDEGTPYEFFEDEGILKIAALPMTRAGGGIGKCPANRYKTFTYSLSRKQAEAAYKVITIGQGAVKSLATLLSAPLGVWNLGASIALNFLGGDSLYKSNLKAFLNSNKSTLYVRIKGKCVNRGYMYGDPMYDYEAVSMHFDW